MTIFISSISLSGNINAVILLAIISLSVPASSADAATVNPNEIKSLLANSAYTVFNNGKSVFSNGSKSRPKIPTDYTILDSWVFYIFILAGKLLSKALQTFETCL